MFERTSASRNDAGKAVRTFTLAANYKMVGSLAGAALLAALAVMLSFWAFAQIEASEARRQHNYDLVLRANALLSKIKDAETSERGYALTGEEAFLEPYLAVRDTVAAHLEDMHALTRDPRAVQHLDALTSLVTAKMAHLSRNVELRRQNLPAAITAETRGTGKRLMDAVRTEISGYVEVENVLTRQVEMDFKASMRRLFALIVTTSLFAFLLTLSFAYLIYRETQHRLDDLVHRETEHLLDVQETLNKQLQQTCAAAEISEEKLAITLNSIGDAVIATDADGRVTLVNPLAQRLTGWSLAEAFNRPVEEIFTIINQVTRLPLPVPVRDTLANNSVHGLANHTILIARDGSECDIADSCAPIHTRAGQVVGAVLVFRDVTERARLDKILMDQNAELNSARDLAEKANLAKSDFVSSMSHELRTPLSAILGFAQLMESGTLAPTASQKRSIDQILKAGWYLLDLINEILDLALIESGKLSLSMEPVSLGEVMQECETMIEPQARKRGIKVTFPHFKQPCRIKCDRTHVKQIIVNLLSNAIKYNTVDGSVVVSYVLTAAQRVRLSFQDTGKGLAPEKVLQLFQPFNRLGQETSIEEGTGIGLVMCKRLVELMGGAIGVDSVVGKGSVFWIELNVTTEPPALPFASGDTAPAAENADPQTHTLLYVEDNPANLMLVQDLIARRPDMRLLTARDGVSGIETALAARPDLILMDLNLPGISGIDALRVLAQHPATAHIPIIALSANAMPRDIEKGLEAGFFRYLTKPIKVNEFMSTLDIALHHRKTPEALDLKED